MGKFVALSILIILCWMPLAHAQDDSSTDAPENTPPVTETRTDTATVTPETEQPPSAPAAATEESADEQNKSESSEEEVTWEAPTEPEDSDETDLSAVKPYRPVTKDNVFSVLPIGVVFAGPCLSYTRTFHENVTGSFSFIYTPPVLSDAHDLGGEFALQFWLHRRANNGWFFGPYFQAGTSFGDDDKVVSIIYLVPGMQFGYRWIFENGFTTSVGGGTGWGFVIQEDACPSGYSCKTIGSGFKVKLLFDLGYAW